MRHYPGTNDAPIMIKIHIEKIIQIKRLVGSVKIA